MHGEKGFKLNETVNLTIENYNKTRIYLEIPEGNILLVNNNQKVYLSQILAEIKKDANLILEEDSKHVYTQVSGEAFFQNVEINNVLDKQGAVNKISKKAGLIWVLHGERYSLPKSTIIETQVSCKLSSEHILARQQTLNNYSGLVKFDLLANEKLLKILYFSLMLKNTKLIRHDETNSTLIISSTNVKKKFQLEVKNRDFLVNGQTIAVLKEDLYKTQTGGIICYDTEENKATKKRRSTKKVFSGLLYWIPEETHVLNSSLIDNLKIQPNSLIPK